jgi:hypothetical protein
VQQYAERKQFLAQAHRHDRNAYTVTETDFVAIVLQQDGIDLLPRTVIDESCE